MKQDLNFGPTPWCKPGCRCDRCVPKAPADEAGFPFSWTIGLLVAGVTTAFAIDFLIDRLADGPGVFALFGW